MSAAAAGGRDAADEVAAGVLADLLTQAHLMAPGALTAVLAERARPLGVRGVRIYLADLQQRHLHLLPGDGAHSPAVLSIDSTLADRAFQTVTIHRASAEAAAGSLVQLWVPLVDGTERLGVLELVVEDAGEAMLSRYRTLASLAGLLIASKGVYSDTYARVRRTREVALQAELVWGFLAPATFATGQVIVSAVLEPAYEVGGEFLDPEGLSRLGCLLQARAQPIGQRGGQVSGQPAADLLCSAGHSTTTTESVLPRGFGT